MAEQISKNLAINIRALREKRGMSQQQIARLAEIPRPTWANLESGEANPTVSVLTKVAAALDVGVEKLLAPIRSDAQLYSAANLPIQKKGRVSVRALTPERLVGLALERLAFAVGGQLQGPQLPPNSRYLIACETGELEITIASDTHRLKEGDVLQYTATDRCLLKNVGRARAIAYSVVAFRAGDA